MKVATISLNVNTFDLNYGAMLHSWAFQKYLESIGIENVIIDYTTPKLFGKNLKHPWIILLQKGRIKSAVIAIFKDYHNSKRFLKFEEFKNNNMKLTEKKYSRDTLSREDLDYDALICESDVIWDPNFFGGDFDDSFFLAFDNMKKCRRIAYSASAANIEFNIEQAENFKRLLKNLDHVSCREAYLAEYCSDITGQYVPCVLDPVLLLTAEDYKPITGKRLISEPYLLLYIPVGYDIDLILTAKKYADEKKIKLIEISSYPWDIIFSKTFLDAGIEEFLSLIKYSEIVFTNSFHAVCFSLIFHKEFYAFHRETGKKTEDFCKRFDLSERYINGELTKCDKIDYSRVDKKILELSELSKKYIYESLTS